MERFPIGAVIKMNGRVDFQQNRDLLLRVDNHGQSYTSNCLYICTILRITPYTVKKIGDTFTFSEEKKADLIISMSNRMGAQYLLRSD